MVGIKLTSLTLFHACVCSTPAHELSALCLCLFHASTWILCFMFVSVPRQHLNSLLHVCVFSTRWKVIVRFLSFLFISIYKYNAKTNQIYIYSIKCRQITYIQNNFLIYLNFQTYINSKIFFIVWSLCSVMRYKVNIFYDYNYQL